MAKPQIILGGNEGINNLDPGESLERLRRGRQYEDLSTVCVIPTRGQIAARVVESWMGLMTPMNQPFFRMVVERMEVADAYNAAIETVLTHPQLKDFRYLLTLEEDNLPQPDGLLKLYESIGQYDAVGGLYWTKGWAGQPMIYGRPGCIPQFAPQCPEDHEWGTIIECNGLGMGFTLFQLDLFRELEAPWFQTMQGWDPQAGAHAATQDLAFCAKAKEAGCRFACDTSVLVGHYDHSDGGRVW